MGHELEERFERSNSSAHTHAHTHRQQKSITNGITQHQSSRFVAHLYFYKFSSFQK